MPAGEVIDYIKILNEETQREKEEIEMAKVSNKDTSINDIKMAGSSLPGTIF